MSQLDSNYARPELKRMLDSMAKSKSTFPKKLVTLCVAGLAAGLLAAQTGSYFKTNFADQDKPVTTRTMVSQVSGVNPTEFDNGLRTKLMKAHALVITATRKLDHNPAVERAFQGEAEISSLSAEQKAVYQDVETAMVRSKVYLANIHTAIDEQRAQTVIDGKTSFLLADDLAERLENAESSYQATIQRVGSLQQEQGLSL